MPSSLILKPPSVLRRHHTALEFGRHCKPALGVCRLVFHLSGQQHACDWLGFEAAYVLYCVTWGASVGIVCSCAFLRLVSEGRAY
jgi:hypothetical protein